MKISIIGTGYVGLVSGTCLSEMGNDVTCIDIVEEKINNLNNGIIPIYENGLTELISKNKKNCRLHFSTEFDSIKDSDIVFCAVGTPPNEDGSADLKYVLSVASMFGKMIDKYTIFATKSTVPVGTAEMVRSAIETELNKRGLDIEFSVVSNPEFLKEGDAVNDFMNPDRVVIGSNDNRSTDIMLELYKDFDNVIVMDTPSAEMTKYASNSMLATRISFMNDISNLCELVGANVESVKLGMGSDSRIGNKFLNPGCGYGGSCFPKDVKALIKLGEQNGYEMKVIKSVESVNEYQKTTPYLKLKKELGDLKGKTIGILGLAFKPETDDMREAPSLVVIDLLLKDGCKVKVYDPIAMDECKRRIGDVVEYCNGIEDCMDETEATLLITEWKEFKKIKDIKYDGVIIYGRKI